QALGELGERAGGAEESALLTELPERSNRRCVRNTTWEDTERRGRELGLREGDTGLVEQQPAEPADGRALIDLGFRDGQHDADAQRVVESDAWQLRSGGTHKRGVAGMQRAFKARVRRSLRCHEHMFAS